jgi:hypothetical protein
LANQSDRSSSNTLPPLELNPLSSPLLAENLRRWAEVYFSNPPERREEAVAALLQELRAEKAERAGIPVPRSSDADLQMQSAFPAFASTRESEPQVRCKSCGHDNPVSQRFCGMCGAAVSAEESLANSRVERSEEPAWQPETFRTEHDDPQAGNWRSEADLDSDDLNSGYEEIPQNNNELSLFQSVPRGSYDDGDWQYEPTPSQPYRVYIGLVLAVILAGLGYMAWRGMQANSQGHQVSPPPPAVANDDAPPPPAANTSKPNEAAPVKTPAETAPAEAGKRETAKAEDTDGTQPKSSRHAAETNLKPAAAEPDDTAGSTPSGKGEEELQMAQRYLSGANGGRRDTAEASKWLWRSIAKHNDKATLLLADLYLRGDGVSKNCDQARVLLYSAARKGLSGAGDRLRNLQAFGCQ